MSQHYTYTQPQTEILWLKTEGNVCEATSTGSGFEDFIRNNPIVW